MNEQVREMAVGVDAIGDAIHVSKLYVSKFINIVDTGHGYCSSIM